MKIYECAQYSPEWWQLRRGVPTASEFGRILTPVKEQPSTAQKSYIAQLIADTASLNPNFFTERAGHTVAMRNGIDCEPEARRWYEFERGVDVRQVGFVTTDDGRFGCSPDGLVGDDGGLELKCPTLETQAAYLMDGCLPDEYKCQVHGCLIVTGAKWWDFMSYAPGLDPLLIRVVPDGFTEKLRAALDDFWIRYQEAKAKLIKHGSAADAKAVAAAPDGPVVAMPPPHEIIARWNAWLDNIDHMIGSVGEGAAIDAMNAGLPDLALLKGDPETKIRAWELVCSFVEPRGWRFNKSTKKFEIKREPDPAF